MVCLSKRGILLHSLANMSLELNLANQFCEILNSLDQRMKLFEFTY